MNCNNTKTEHNCRHTNKETDLYISQGTSTALTFRSGREAARNYLYLSTFSAKNSEKKIPISFEDLSVNNTTSGKSLTYQHCGNSGLPSVSFRYKKFRAEHGTNASQSKPNAVRYTHMQKHRMPNHRISGSGGMNRKRSTSLIPAHVIFVFSVSALL